MLDIIGSDPNNFGCMHCNSHDRERHLFMFFDRLNIWEKMKNVAILHFAPEKNLSEKISKQEPLQYVCADLYPKDQLTQKIDLTRVPYSNDVFDIVIANHVLEHIPNYLEALNEIYRVLKPNGAAVLQTPYTKLLEHNFELSCINTSALRSYYYGQSDHVRIFSRSHLFGDIEGAGFVLKIKKNDDLFSEELARYYGVNKNEDLILAYKPQESTR
ncbi:class I SAM-dependent methyltransferase [Candidatus Uhrbacteria bacterium]|nr:class I SAM-dependent methyltransferase [Candidatus Uhrbacteria bacterium]